MTVVPRAHFRTALVAISALAITACGGDKKPVSHPTTQTPTDTSGAFSSVLHEVFGAMCDRMTSCESSWGKVFTDRDTCILLTMLDADLYWRDFSEYDQYFGFDSDKLNSCLSQFETMPCDAGTGELSCLEDAIVGKLQAGDCCPNLSPDISVGDPCAPGLECEMTELGLGMCVAKSGDTESCANVHCADGLFCDGSQVCTPLKKLDEACVPFSEPCEEGLYCEAGGASPVCKLIPGAEQPCGDNSVSPVCDDASYCDTGTCKARGDKGADCQDAGQCLSYLTCTNLKCAPQDGEVGAACSSNGDCPLGADCVGGATKTCVAKAGLNETCDPSRATAANCAMPEGIKCDGGTCVALPTLDQTCSPGDACWPLDEVYCDSTASTCKKRLAAWQPCEPANSFVNHPCELGAACDLVLKVCIPYPETPIAQTICPAQ